MPPTFFRQIAERIALAGIVILAGCSQDPSGPATASGLQPIDRSADVKTPTGITIRLFAFDNQSVGVPVPFSTTGAKIMDFTLAAGGGAGGIASSVNISPLPPGSYFVAAQAPAGYEIFQSVCGVSEGSDLVVPDASSVAFVLAKKGWGHCDLTLGALP